MPLLGCVHGAMQVHNARIRNPYYLFPPIDAAVQNASSPHYPGSATTAYTGLLALDDETLLVSYDRLANGWAGPPGSMGGSDGVFSMTVKITAAAPEAGVRTARIGTESGRQIV